MSVRAMDQRFRLYEKRTDTLFKLTYFYTYVRMINVALDRANRLDDALSTELIRDE